MLSRTCAYLYVHVQPFLASLPSFCFDLTRDSMGELLQLEVTVPQFAKLVFRNSFFDRV